MRWQVIKDFPNYQVSETGQVKNIKFNRTLSFSRSHKKFTTYLRVTLFKDNQRFYRSVHRLVAESFLPNPFNFSQVDHIDANGENNYVSNLQWITPSENIKKSFLQNSAIKTEACKKGGLKGGFKNREKAKQKYKQILGNRFKSFHPSGALIQDACVTYICECGSQRTASVMWKELRLHKGKCPVCTNTVNRSSESLL